MNMAFGPYLRGARERKGVTQRQMAEQCGVSQSAWSRIENGRSELSLRQLQKASALLGMPMWVIVRDVERAE